MTAPSAFDTIFWVTTRTSSAVSGVTPGVRAMAFAMMSPRSSPIRISGMPRSARTVIACSAHIGCRLRERFDEDEVVRGVEVHGEGAVDLEVGGAGRLSREAMGGAAAGTERDADRVGRA